MPPQVSRLVRTTRVQILMGNKQFHGKAWPVARCAHAEAVKHAGKQCAQQKPPLPGCHRTGVVNLPLPSGALPLQAWGPPRALTGPWGWPPARCAAAAVEARAALSPTRSATVRDKMQSKNRWWVVSPDQCRLAECQCAHEALWACRLMPIASPNTPMQHSDTLCPLHALRSDSNNSNACAQTSNCCNVLLAHSSQPHLCHGRALHAALRVLDNLDWAHFYATA